MLTMSGPSSAADISFPMDDHPDTIALHLKPRRKVWPVYFKENQMRHASVYVPLGSAVPTSHGEKGIAVCYSCLLNASSSSRISFITASKSGSWPKYISRIFS